jgi:hypothetical protein
VRRFRVQKSPARAITKPTAEPVVDLSTLSTDQLFKHYRSTAPLGDVRFMLAHATMSAGLRFAFEVLEAAIVELRIKDRKTIYREYESLQTNCSQWARQYLDSLVVTVPANRQLPAASVVFSEAA